jgi:hypothetical protein
VNPAGFAYNGQVTLQVYVDNLPVESGYLGAFVDDECRGIIGASYFPPQQHYVFELICYSNEATGEIMSLRYLDTVDCKILTLFTDSIEFVADMTMGDAVSPFELDYPATISIDNSFVTGWNWFSVNAQGEDMSLGHLLSCANETDFIMNQSLSATYYADAGWHGSLEDAGGLDPASLYKIKVLDPCGINYAGIPLDPSSESLSLVPGWNWIGYLPQCVVSVADALSSLTLQNGDYIKNQTESATYYEGFGWFGSLVELTPGEGYMLRKNTADILQYPDCPSAENGVKKHMSAYIIESDSLLNPHQFQYNGTVTSEVYVDGVPAGGADDLVMAHVDDETRGVMPGLYFQPKQSYVYPLMLYSNLAEGDTLSFKYYDADQDRWYQCLETLVFTDDMVAADAFDAFELHVSTVSVPEDPARETSLSLDVSPNPFSDQLHIKITIVERSIARLTLFDIMGRMIEILDERTLVPGTYSIDWDASGFSDGIYMLQLTNEGSKVIKKVLLNR